MTGVRYTTREAVVAGPNFGGSAITDQRIDDAIDAATLTIEERLHRRFYPQTATRYFDWPNRQYARRYRLWLESNEMIAVTAVVSGGVTLDSSDYFLRRSDDLDEPPYDQLQIDRSSSASLSSGDTSQKSIAVTGRYGANERTRPAGTVAEALDSSETGADVSNSAAVGVGDTIKVESEWMLVTGKSWLDSTQNLGANIAADKSVTTVAVTTGSDFNAGEYILIDAEKLLIESVAGNNLIVRRAQDGTVLAAHTSGADIFLPRTLTVERGALGTTAAAHDTGLAVARLEIPGPVRKLATALSIDTVLQEQTGYGRTLGGGENAQEAYGRALKLAWKEAISGYARRREGAV